MRRWCRERFPRHRGLAIPTCITTRAWCTCRDACRDRKLVVPFEVGGGQNVLAIPGACAPRNFMYLVRVPRPGTSKCLLHVRIDKWYRGTSVTIFTEGVTFRGTAANDRDFDIDENYPWYSECCFNIFYFKKSKKFNLYCSHFGTANYANYIFT